MFNTSQSIYTHTFSKRGLLDTFWIPSKNVCALHPLGEDMVSLKEGRWRLGCCLVQRHCHWSPSKRKELRWEGLNERNYCTHHYCTHYCLCHEVVGSATERKVYLSYLDLNKIHFATLGHFPKILQWERERAILFSTGLLLNVTNVLLTHLSLLILLPNVSLEG